MTEEEYKIVDCMEKYGGSFVKSLAQCFRHADTANFRKLFTTFNDYWEIYKEMSK